MRTGSRLAGLECRACCAALPPDNVVGTCPTCGHTLFAVYDTSGWDAASWWREVAGRPATLWRYREMLPVRESAMVATLGEGFTPVVELGEVPGLADVHVLAKDDGLMPTGSFKARGMSVAVSRAAELGLQDLFVPSAGNAGTALSAYAARSGRRARVYVPERTPEAIKWAIRSYGAELVMVPGTIRDAGEAARAREKGRGSFDMSTLREPYRVEGKKTMGFEIVEQLGPDALPDAIVYPTGGGTGLVGMAKAFRELRGLGLLDRSPRLYAVQPENCAPVVRALRDGAASITAWTDPFTIAPGLLVPAPFSSERILEAVRDSHGGGVTVSDRAIVLAMRALAVHHGLSASPEAAATYAALPQLRADGAIRAGERVLLYLTGTGLVYSIDELDRAVAR